MRREIPRNEWGAFLAALERRLVKSETEVTTRVVRGGEVVPLPLARRLPLAELTLEPKGPEAGAIMVRVRGDGGEFEHAIRSPVRLIAHELPDGRLAALEIEDVSGARTLIHTSDDPAYADVAAEVPWWRMPLVA